MPSNNLDSSDQTVIVPAILDDLPQLIQLLMELFEMEGDFRGHGNDSWAFSQKGIRFYTRDQYGYANKIDHQIFPNQKN